MNHLSDEDCALYLGGAPSAETSRHLESCSDCQGEIEQLRLSLGAFRSAAVALGEKHAPAAIGPGRTAASRHRHRAHIAIWSLAGALAAAAAIPVFVHVQQGQHPPAQTGAFRPSRASSAVAGAASANSQISQDDDALLSDVSTEISEGVPPAMQPLASRSESSGTGQAAVVSDGETQ